MDLTRLSPVSHGSQVGLSAGAGPRRPNTCAPPPPSPSSRKAHALPDPSLALPPPACLLLSPTLRSTLLLLPWRVLHGLPAELSRARESPCQPLGLLTCQVPHSHPGSPAGSPCPPKLPVLEPGDARLHSGAALDHKTASVCPASPLGCPRETRPIIGSARALDRTSVSFLT